mmetsp:Transcript_43188/g.101537  ORF Transcript_43188/g.101537 Transcript_43188/m.101537 type:complete len:321 (-) Transcript_43188:19-981(-)
MALLEEEPTDAVIPSLRRSCFRAEQEEAKGDRFAISVIRASTRERMFDTPLLLSPTDAVLDLAEAVAVKATLPVAPRLTLAGGKLLNKLHLSLEAVGLYDHAEIEAELHPAIVTASSDGTAKIWNAETGNCERTLCGHAGAIHSAVFSSESKSVATSSADQLAKIWNAATGRCKWTLKGHKDAVYSIEFSPDNRSVVTASGDRTARIWSARSGVCSMVLRGHTGAVVSAVFDAGGERVFTRESSSRTRIWNVRTGTCEGDASELLPLYSRSASPDGLLVAAAPGDCTALVLDANTGSRELILEGHKGLVYTAVFSPPYLL